MFPTAVREEEALKSDPSDDDVGVDIDRDNDDDD